METKIIIKSKNEFTDSFKKLVFNLLNEQHKEKVCLKKDKIISYCMIYKYLLNNNINLDINNLYYSKNGKPLLDGIYFNISNKDDLYVLAVSKYNVGVDIERVCNYDEKVLKYFYTLDEKADVKSNEDFFRIFTLKESYIKMKNLYFDSFFLDDYKKYYYKTIKYKDYIISYVIDKKR